MAPDLAEFFIKFLTDEDDLVLDPFGGSNTTGSMAEQLGRRWITLEPKAEYIEGSRGRFGADVIAEATPNRLAADLLAECVLVDH